MQTYLLRRGITSLVTVFLVVTLVFFLLRIMPGDPVQQILGLDAPEARVREIRHLLGLDRPIHLQYLTWLKDVCLGNLGTSLRSQESVTSLLFSRLPVTLWLALLASLLALAIAFPLGIVSALRPWSWIDVFSLFAAQVGLAVPSFWLGILLILLFAVKLEWLPLLGYVNFSESPVEWLRHLILPAFALGCIRAAILTRMIRTAMLEELGKEYVVVARAKGVKEYAVILHHALRNALLPVITIAGLQIGYLLGGAIIIEQIFGLPGVGRLLLSAILGRDFPVVQGIVVFIALAFTGLNFVIDMLYGLLNPKISLAP
ncbi:ABC transporter permease subunit [candidate division KSB3 bacterium]|uniref:ABC transporter permease subunit n=1 Tax=candidate division KSB3 bacterium TaxID=2044937 RepID=A0A9D5JXW5_9BACT|nr:ABC transporter permease subunit [candidate division KSB3 bacterium]MBD3325852.1 ABC transporter permease subunit [candidate division KSB3 bacterium]